MPVGPDKVICVSIAHISFGILMIACGAVQVILQLKYLWLDSFYPGIWVGIWMSTTGIMGVIASFKIKFFVVTFMIFSTISALIGLAGVSYYANTAATSWDVYWASHAYLAISSVTCILAIVEVIIGIVAGFYSCLIRYDDAQSEQARVPFTNTVVPVEAAVREGDDREPSQDTQLPMVDIN